MKRLFLTLTVVFSLFTLSSFADEGTIAYRAKESFNNTFRNASEINWSTTSNLYKVNFNLNGQYIAAFYDAEGKMIAMTRNISSTQLPIALQTSLKSYQDKYWISDLFEVGDDSGTTYYITLENADTKLILKSASNSDWTNYQKQRKS